MLGFLGLGPVLNPGGTQCINRRIPRQVRLETRARSPFRAGNSARCYLFHQHRDLLRDLSDGTPSFRNLCCFLTVEADHRFPTVGPVAPVIAPYVTDRGIRDVFCGGLCAWAAPIPVPACVLSRSFAGVADGSGAALAAAQGWSASKTPHIISGRPLPGRVLFCLRCRSRTRHLVY